jgi:aspartokinase/homoserine dehydrogenase 1
MKFGGTSLRDPEAIVRVRDLVKAANRQEPVAVVVSAIAGVTDQLISAARSSLTSYQQAKGTWEAISTRHQEIIDELLSGPGHRQVTDETSGLLAELRDLLHGVHLVRECSALTMDLIVSYGERLSALIVAQVLAESGCPACSVDARPLVRTNGRAGAAVVCLEITAARIRDALLPVQQVSVITGFIAANQEGVTTTLGRNGSDYTATLFGAALQADEIEIWSDVDGIFNADPRLIPGSRTIDGMTFEEAQEMAYFGASIVHPQALQPAAEANIPVVVRNTFNPGCPGTRITCGNGNAGAGPPVRGISTVDGVALVNLEGSGMIGIPGIAGRLFTALAARNVNIIMISQASSEHSICFVTRHAELAAAAAAVEETFVAELSARLIQRVEQLEDLAVVSVIGTRMRGTVGLSGRLFAALGEQGVNVLAISQGCSERNISIVVRSADKVTALQAVHSAFALDRAPAMG